MYLWKITGVGQEGAKLTIESIFGLLGGLALFLYGMQMMSVNLETAAGSRMKQILEKLTSNRLLGVCVGAGITAVIQSSSATTVMVVGFVNSGLMTLKQAVWIIMGANIGTTVTGQLIALDIGALAPLITFAGVALILFVKRKNIQFAGGIIAGLGILFLGMGMMGDAMVPLGKSEAFVSLMTRFSNPFLGILAGALFTAIIQSSSASVGILQALAVSGLIGIDSAVFVLFGQNIGTCITAALASIGASRDAKRATLIHLMFNMIGTAVFTAVCLIWPLASVIGNLTPDNPAAQLANVHTLFNVVTTLMLLPFGTKLAWLAGKILPDKPRQQAEEERWFEELLSSDRVLGVSVIARKQLNEDIGRMLRVAAENVEKSFLAFEEKDQEELKKIREREDEIDLMNARLSRKISKVLTVEHSPYEVDALHRMFIITGNVERIGDHAKNIAGYAETMMIQGLELSKQAREELTQMRHSSGSAIKLLCGAEQAEPEELVRSAGELEQRIDDQADEFRANQIRRMGSGSCDVETSILYSEILTDFERIGDHVLNIARAGSGTDRTDFRRIGGDTL